MTTAYVNTHYNTLGLIIVLYKNCINLRRTCDLLRRYFGLRFRHKKLQYPLGPTSKLHPQSLPEKCMLRYKLNTYMFVVILCIITHLKHFFSDEEMCANDRAAARCTQGPWHVFIVRVERKSISAHSVVGKRCFI